MKNIHLLFYCIIGLVACKPTAIPAPTPSALPRTPIAAFHQEVLPFKNVTGVPEGEFLFVFLSDNTCLQDQLCECTMMETFSKPFEFVDNILYISDYNITFQNQGVNHSDLIDWKSFRRKYDAHVLYAYYNPWYTELALSVTFPVQLSFPYEVFKITVIGANPQGDVQIKTRDGYAIVSAGSMIVIPEHSGNDCKAPYLYYFTNYGFIRDENVRFWDAGSK